MARIARAVEPGIPHHIIQIGNRLARAFMAGTLCFFYNVWVLSARMCQIYFTESRTRQTSESALKIDHGVALSII